MIPIKLIYIIKLIVIQFPKKFGDPGKICRFKLGYMANVVFWTIDNWDQNASF